MQDVHHTTKRVIAVAATTGLLLIPWAPAFAGHLAGEGNSNGKQTICHATDSNTNPYVVNTPNKNGDVSGHADHTGPTWNPDLKAQHLKWGDIIPAFDYNDHGTPAHFAGLNWDANGQAWFANNCKVPITGTVDKTNDANLDATFSDDETATSAGADVPFTVVVTNTSVVPVVVTSLADTVVDAVVPFTPTPDPVGSTLAAGASVTFTFTASAYSPPDGGVLVNTMTVGLANAADASNHTLVQDSSTVRTAVPAPDVSIVKTGPATVSPGDDLTWTLTVHNDGPVTVPDVTVTDSLPSGTTLVSVGGTGWTCTGTTDLSCTLDSDLGIDGTSAITVVATLAADYTAATVSNTAVVTPEDATPADNTSTATTDVTQGGGGFTGGGGGVTLPRTGRTIDLAATTALAMVLIGSSMMLLAPRRATR